ncbi:GNAT family acetyltransferase [Burkholderia ubonensis]|uniref:GNAT family acetyltransferase n=1 Tax=Burkholderia ubonensis TaxID=101571 RepID=A0A107I4N9_9BURK|nr:acetyltransferase [Burkholderia ubonensis]KWE47518.1 GNAT family acetyltransferase [Burkholderia ubonensis]KWK72913.1 GNAT family acetyltransferase [Burkholderia ubonensis]
MTIRERTPEDNPALLDIWHRAVQATHAFLTERDIAELYPQVRDLYLPSVAVWVAEADDGRVAGFIGVNDAQVEMLFVDPERFGQRVGTRLLDHVRAKHARLTVDVNEQNPRAHAFYRRYGFRDVGRSATDSAGRPFPLIHMAY